jgi:hypothetical protein
MTSGHNPAARGLRCAVLVVAAMLAGCAATAPGGGARAGTALLDRAHALIQHCPELACTTADVPGCGFSEDVDAGGVTVRAEIECAREGTATACVERRRPLGGENQTLQNQRLKFRCGGDPLRCVLTGGNAIWPAAIAGKSGGEVSCHAPRRAGPSPAPHSIPGPDTAKAGGIAVHATLA